MLISNSATVLESSGFKKKKHLHGSMDLLGRSSRLPDYNLYEYIATVLPPVPSHMEDKSKSSF